METAIIDKVIENLKALPEERQQQVLEFARSLAQATPRGVSGKEILRFAGTIPPEDASLMSEVLARNCEQVDSSEW